MKKKTVILMLFAILAVFQLAQPLYMAWRWEDILETGVSYRWRTAPVDPYDALRGRYIDLRFAENRGPVIQGESIKPGQTVYALLGTDTDGFAYITGITAQKPALGDYVETRAGYMLGENINVILPFKRFYMREDLASQAEQVYWRTAGREGSVSVRIKNGMGVIEQLYIGDKTIDEYLRSESNNAKGKLQVLTNYKQEVNCSYG